MNKVYKTEVGISEKHKVELRVNLLTGMEEIFVDGVSVIKKFSMSGVDEVVEVGAIEKHKVRVKFGIFQLLGKVPVFTVDGAASPSAGTTARDKAGAAVSLMAAVVAFVLGKYIGLPLIVLGFVWLLLTAIYCKAGKKKVETLNGLLAGLQSAYALWFLLAALSTGQYASAFFDFAVLSVFTVWLLARPNKAAFISVITYHALIGLLNVIQLFAPLDESMKPYIVLHILLHLLSVGIGGVCLAAKPKSKE